MYRLKRVAQLFMLLIIVLVILVFVLENQQGVSLSFLGLMAPQAPASFFIVGALIAGMVIGPALGLVVRRKT